MKQDAAMAGVLVSMMGPGHWLKDAKNLGIKIPGGVEPEGKSCQHHHQVMFAHTLLFFFPFFQISTKKHKNYIKPYKKNVKSYENHIKSYNLLDIGIPYLRDINII